MSELDYTTQLICNEIHRRAKDLGYSDDCIKRASAKALDMRPTGKGLVILPGTHPKTIATWADMLLDEAARER